MRSHQFKNSQQGFGIVEVLVAGSLLTILIAAMSSFMSDSFKSQKKIDMKGAISSTSNQITAMISSADLCERGLVISGQALPGHSLGSPNPTVPSTSDLVVTSLQIKSSTSASATPIITAGTDVIPGLRVQSIRLKLENDLGVVNTTRRIVANLRVTYDSSNSSLNSSMRPIDYPMILSINTATTNGVITSCAGGVGLIEQNVCQNLFNGNYDDTAVPRCKIRNFSFSDTDRLADLGAGLAATDTVALRSNTGGRGFSVYGTNPMIGFFLNGPNVASNTNPATIVRSGDNLQLSTPAGGRVTTGAFTASGAATLSSTLSVTGNTALSALSVTGNITSPTSPAASDITGFDQISAVTFTASSDRNLKENLTPLADASDKIARIKTYNYNFKNDPEKKLHTGVVAQEIEKVIPHLVSTTPDGTLAVNYNELIPYLLKNQQEMSEKIKKLERKLEKFEKK